MFKDGISSLKKRGCAVGLLWTTGLQVLGTAGLCGQLIEEGGSPSLLGISSDQFSRALLQNKSFDSSCCERVDPQTSLLSQLLSITLSLVKAVTLLYLHSLGAVTKREVPPVRAAGLSHATVTPRSRELQNILAWPLVLLQIGGGLLQLLTPEAWTSLNFTISLLSEDCSCTKYIVLQDFCISLETSSWN